MKNAKEEIMCEDATKLAEMSQENFVKDGRVYIMGPFDRSISSKVIPDFIGLIDCIRFSKQPAIEIFINSGGGYSSELYALLSVIDMAKEEGIKMLPITNSTRPVHFEVSDATPQEYDENAEEESDSAEEDSDSSDSDGEETE